MKDYHWLFVKTMEYKWNTAPRAGNAASAVRELMLCLAGQLGYELFRSFLSSSKYLRHCRTVISSFYYYMH